MYAMFKYNYIVTLMHKGLNAFTNPVSETEIFSICSAEAGTKKCADDKYYY